MKLNLLPLNSDRVSVAISLWAAEMPADATRHFMCLEAIITTLNSLLNAVTDIICQAVDCNNN
jgi:hypothetical protein